MYGDDTLEDILKAGLPGHTRLPLHIFARLWSSSTLALSKNVDQLWACRYNRKQSSMEIAKETCRSVPLWGHTRDSSSETRGAALSGESCFEE
jgi:hypothetical protein